MATIRKQKQHLDFDGKAVIDANLVNCYVNGKKLDEIGGGDVIVDIHGMETSVYSPSRLLTDDEVSKIMTAQCVSGEKGDFWVGFPYTESFNMPNGTIVKPFVRFSGYESLDPHGYLLVKKTNGTFAIGYIEV